LPTELCIESRKTVIGAFRIPARSRLSRAATALAIFTALLFVISSMSSLVIASGQQPFQDDGIETILLGQNRTATLLMPSWDAENWDWTSMVDSSGYVSVIFSFGNGSAPDSARSLQDALREHVGSTLAYDLVDEQTVIAGHSLSAGFSGYSARIEPNVLESLADSWTGMSVYPDLPVKATLENSVVQIGADQIWSRIDAQGSPVTGTGVTVAVIDTGIDYDHPDLGGGFGADYKVVGGYDFYNGDSDPMDDNGHGTHVAGIIAANGIIKGVAPSARLLAYKALGADGSGLMSDVIEAIQRAMDPNNDGNNQDHADIISMSLGGAGEAGDPVCLAVRSAVSAGVVVVVAAGNEGPAMGTVASPGLAPEAITVGAIDDEGTLASFSSRGTAPDLLIKPEISAPGVSINSTVPYQNARYSSPTGYMPLSGTSMATPHVSGAVALLLQLHQSWTPQQVKSALIAGASSLNESLWTAGSGGLWLPGSADLSLFSSNPLVSYNSAGDSQVTITIQNTGAARTVEVSVADWFSLAANGSSVAPNAVDLAFVSPTTLSLPDGGSGAFILGVAVPSPAAMEGYYEGDVVARYGTESVRFSLGYSVLSRLNVHVLDASGSEVFDPYGGVWVYDLPDANTAFSIQAGAKPSPPASFLLPSGSYSVHAAGHELLYSYSDPYLLSAAVSLARMETRDVFLRMSDARQLVLDLETQDGNPIYVKDYRIYLRHASANNVSFHLVGTDYFVSSPDLPSLPRSRTVYVSDTDETIGISIAGFSYTPDMWDFVSRNWQHWYESVDSSSPGFYIESSADLQYLLSWEFNGVDSSTPTALTVIDGQASVYETKYDIPGQIGDPWCDWDTRLPMGAESTFYTRRDTQTPINPFYSGMTRETIVQGVFSEIYFPGNLFGGYSEAEYYVPDYKHVVHAASASEIYLPDRNYLTPVNGVVSESRMAAGPFYPSLRTMNTNSTFVLIHPLLRDQSGAKVGGISVPRMNLLQNGMDTGVYQLSEYRARPDAMRVVALSGSGAYTVKIHFDASAQVSNSADIELGFSVPGVDLNPPMITSLKMPQRFVPGTAVPLSITVSDDRSTASVSISWRSNSTAPWITIPTARVLASEFSAEIQTSSTDISIDLKIVVTDEAGNYLQYVTTNACLKQVSVRFDISAGTTDVPYRNSSSSVVLTGYLTDLTGNPLHQMAAVPLELIANGKKVGLILDEYALEASHSHNGTIRFTWVFNPYRLFSASDQTIDVLISFDLGTYEPVSRTFSLHSILYNNEPPQILLLTPANGSLFTPGTVIDLSIADVGSIAAEYSVDGGSHTPLSSPWDISTSTWSDGNHIVDVYATDEDSATSHSAFNFDLDGSAPVVNILSPRGGSLVPKGFQMALDVSDAHLLEVRVQVDSGLWQVIGSPYSVDMTGWSEGYHFVAVEAEDVLGHVASTSVFFEIANSTVVINLESPADGAIMRSGGQIVLDVTGLGTVTCVWSDGGIARSLLPPYEISTAGWTEGQHVLLVNATNDLGGWYELTFAVVIDDSAPSIVLVAPSQGSFVTKNDRILLSLSDPNFESVSWVMWGTTYTSISRNPVIFLDSSPSDGYFQIEVTARDVAGNVAQKSLIFAMDSAAPRIVVEGVRPGEAVASGTVLNVSVEDEFLASVQWSLDNGALQSSTSHFQVGTISLGLGWHCLRAIASDSSGKTTDLNVTYFVDGTPPTVSLSAPSKFVEGSALELVANANDDFKIGSVVLFYELKTGGYSSIGMVQNGSSYTVTLVKDSLWDGMEVFVVAVDSAGNSAESARANLAASPSLPGTGGDGSDRAGNSLSIWSMISSTGGIILLVVVALLGAILLVLQSRRRKDTYVNGSETPAMKYVHKAKAPMPAAPSMKSVAASPRPLSNLAKSMAAVADSHPVSAAIQLAEKTRVTLLDALPEMMIASASSLDEGQNDEIDYGELIERELIVGALKTSVYRDEPVATHFDPGSLEIPSVPGRPIIFRPKNTYA